MSEQRVEFKDGEFLIHTNNGTLKQDGTASVSLEGDFTISADCLRAWLAAAQNKVVVKTFRDYKLIEPFTRKIITCATFYYPETNDLMKLLAEANEEAKKQGRLAEEKEFLLKRATKAIADFNASRRFYERKFESIKL